jgi:hypothetical protein
LGEIACKDLFAGFFYQPKIKSEVVNGGNLQGQYFLYFEEMMQIGFGVQGGGATRGVSTQGKYFFSLFEFL